MVQISRLLSGTIAGFVATVPMSVVMKGVQMLLPEHERYDLPPSVVTFQAEKKTGQPPESFQQHGFLTALTHFGIGAGCGLLYGLGTAPGGKLQNGLVRGTIFGLVVWSVGYLGILPALNLYNSPEREPARRHTMMIVSHLIWGVSTGQVYGWLAPVLKKRFGL